MRYFPELRATIKDELKTARKNLEEELAFRALRLNSGSPLVQTEMLMDYAEYERNCVWDKLPVEREGLCIWGIDVGSTISMSSICAYWPKTGRAEFLSAFASVPGLEEREQIDGVSGVYTTALRRGELILCGETPSLPVSEFIQAAVDRFGIPDDVVF